jgi:hypothetical protein
MENLLARQTMSEMLGDLDGESLGEAVGDMDGTPRRVDRWKVSDDSRKDREAWMEGLGGESGDYVGDAGRLGWRISWRGSGRYGWDPKES